MTAPSTRNGYQDFYDAVLAAPRPVCTRMAERGTAALFEEAVS